MAHNAHAPAFKWDKATTPPSNHEFIRKLDTPGMGAMRLRPT